MTIFSPSDLSEWLACPHAAALALRVKRDDLAKPERVDPQAELVYRKGLEHEARYLQSLRDAARAIVEISFDDRDWERAARATEHAIHSGADVVFQACLVDGDWRGFADFVERQPDGTYEVVDTKLARHARPGYLFQLCFYSSVVGRIQDRAPAHMHLVLGDDTRETFATRDYDAYYRRIRDRFVDFAAAGARDTEPYPCEHCAICVWRERCEAEWQERDHLSLVAGIRRNQVERLVTASITTLEQLAQSPPNTQVARIPDETFATLRDQAALQLHHRRTGEHKLTHLPPQERRGFRLMPRPSPGDVYYDIEGDPFYSSDGSLEYLHGVAYDHDRFQAFWATTGHEERRAFENLVDFLVARRARFPDMHVYHYANYERAALQRLMQKHGTREDEVDDLLRNHVLVDLYQVVRQALRISLPSYSLKQVETLYFPERETDVVGGDESTVVFEQFLESGDRSLLDAIEAYNRDDCLSTLELHRWLLERRPDLAWVVPPEVREPTEEGKERTTERERVQERLRQRGETLLADLLDFHRRDAKPAWWDYFRRLTLDERELIEDSEAIGGIEPTDELPEEVKQSYVYELCFPAQEFKVGSEAIDPATEKSPGTILAIDDGGTIRLRRSKKRHGEPFPRALVPPTPLQTWAQQDALMRLARDPDAYPAARDVLSRARPRARLDTNVFDAALSLDRSYLFVQGPPGTGKTWRGAAAAVALMKAGKRVGVAAQSHKAIHKFLDDVIAQGYEFRGVKKTSDYEGTRYTGSDLIENESDAKTVAAGDHQLVAGTSYLFAREDVHVDTLFIDEAGQVSLADALAIATSADDVVLLGDPNQLPQVSQGAQPKEVRASVLEHLLGDEVTVSRDRGIFLDRTWRLRLELCSFVSEAFYEGRLEPQDVALGRSLAAGNGLRFVEVPHTGNRQRAPEEADWIAAEIRALLGTELTNEHGTRALRPEDVLVVAPYNMQVRCLRSAVPGGVPVGTVDKFQGQQAPVVFFSMTSSGGEEVPRGLDFLFSANRFNVAISRAQCLAYVVASPALLVADAKTPEQMRLLNTVCRFAEDAAPVENSSHSPVRKSR
jgi:predicted RecB family nuclease